MWEKGKLALVNIAKIVCLFVRVSRKNPKSTWWNVEIETAVERK